MFDVLMWLLVIPTGIMAIKFWIRVIQSGLRLRRSFGRRVQRFRSAFAEAGGEEE